MTISSRRFVTVPNAPYAFASRSRLNYAFMSCRSDAKLRTDGIDSHT